MYGWGGKNSAKEVKLVRLEPYDGRVGAYGRKHKAGKAVAMLLAAAFILYICLFGFYYVFDSKAKERSLETAAGAVEEVPGAEAPEGAAASVGEGMGSVVGLLGKPGSKDPLGLSDLSGLSDALGLSGVQGSPGSQGLPNSQDALGMPDSPDVPGSQDASGLPDIPGSQDAPGLPNIPGSQDAPGLPGMPDSSDLPDSRAPLIAIDPGHGGGEEGCGGDGTLEAWANLELARRLSEKLEELGFGTLLIREDDSTCLTSEERVRKAEEAGADIYVSIHGNACKKGKGTQAGLGTWYYGELEDGGRLAKLVHKGAVDKSKVKDRGVQELAELSAAASSSLPSCLVETAFWTGIEGGEDAEFLEYQEKLANGMAWGINLYFNPKTMYLTFDDGPSKDNTTAVLDILKDKGIKATFFLVGENVRKNPEVARRIAEEGHTIGIHCNRHVYEDIYQSVDSYLEDFQEAYDAVYEVTGVEVELFRFPGGSVNGYNKDVREEIIEKMEEKGFIYFDWNASLEDAAKGTTPKKLIQNAVSSTMGRKKIVMLAHDVKSNTVQCLEDLIDCFPEYRMEPLTPEVEPIHF